VTIQYATEVTAIYVSCYAFGRLLGGLLAEKIGVFLTYNILISVMAIALVIAPQTASYMPHTGQISSGNVTVYKTTKRQNPISVLKMQLSEQLK
jgi:nitrate/nitrite transporter NarK